MFTLMNVQIQVTRYVYLEVNKRSNTGNALHLLSDNEKLKVPQWKREDFFYETFVLNRRAWCHDNQVHK